MVAKTEVPGRQKVFGPVLLCPGFPGLENGFLALGAVLEGAEFEIEVRFRNSDVSHFGDSPIFARLHFFELSLMVLSDLLRWHMCSSKFRLTES